MTDAYVKSKYGKAARGVEEKVLQVRPGEGLTDAMTRLLLDSLDEEIGRKTDDFIDPDPVSWIEKHFYIPETDDHRIILYPYQKKALWEALAKDEQGFYKHGIIIWSDTKKSIKSTIAAAVALWLAFQTPWGSVKIIANDLKQADSRESYYIRRCIELNPKMAEICKVRPSGYYIELPNRAKIESVPVDPRGEAGGNDDGVFYTELWGANNVASQRMWTESTLSPTKFGKSFRWVETYAGFSGESPLLEQLYLQATKQGKLVDWANEFDPPLNCYENPQASMFCLWNQTPRLPWLTQKYYCLPIPENKSDLMVLTQSGWKPAVDITLGDSLCTRSELGEIEYQKPTSVFRGPYSGDLIRLNHSKADIVMTPNHRVYCEAVSHSHKAKEVLARPFDYRYIEAQDARKMQIGWIPGHGNWNHLPLEAIEAGGAIYNADDFIELLAWYLSEGSYSVDKRNSKEYINMFSISQDSGVNPEKRKEIEALLSRMNLRHTWRKSGVRVFNTGLAVYMSKFGKSHEKSIPRFVLEECSKAQLLKFLRVYAMGDGTIWKNGTQVIYTNSDQMALDIMELGFKCGYRPSWTGSYGSRGNKPIHHIRLLSSHIGWNPSKKRGNWSVEHADVDVWCPSVPNGNFYVRQNKTCYWTGNSQEEAVLTPNEFQRVHRNQWVSSEQTFVPIEWWDACKDMAMPDMKKDQPVVVAVDAAVSSDTFGVVVVSGRDDGLHFDVRYANAWKAIPGGKIDFSLPEQEIRRLIETYNVVEICYDPYQLVDMAARMKRELIARFHVFNQGKDRLLADKFLYDVIRSRRIHHRGEPTLREHVQNANSTAEDKETLRIIKRSDLLKIDLCVCVSMATYRASHWRI